MGEAGARPRAPQVCALQASLVLYDGSTLLHWEGTDIASTAKWDPITTPDSGLEILDLAVCPDLNGTHQQLFAAIAGGIHSWTWQPDRTGVRRWVPWPPTPFEGTPQAVAGWSLRPGHQELVIAGLDGALLSRRRDGWGEWSDQALIGVVPGVRELEVVVGPGGAVELYATTGTELRRKVLPPGAEGPAAWGNPEVVASWSHPIRAQTVWSSGERDDQAVLLTSGEVHLRQRTPGEPWGPWSAVDSPGSTTTLTSVSGSAHNAEHQLLAAAAADGSVVVKRWSSVHGWTSWRRVSSTTPEAPTQVWSEPRTSASAIAPEPTPAAESTSSTDPTALIQPTPTTQPAPAAQPTPTSRPTPMPDPSLATDPTTAPSTEPPPQARPVETSVLAAAQGPASGDRSTGQSDPITRLITGRELLPLLPGEDRVGPFHLVKRIGGGQQNTDKYLARDRRGYCFLKVLRPEATADEVTAFSREIDIAQRVTNRHRLTTYVDHSPVQGGSPPFLALSFVAGQDLSEQLGSRTLEGSALQDLATQLLRAVAELAECRVIHCDVKPANIIMRDGNVPVLVDFGSAVTADTQTVWEAAFGTSGYAAPEFSSARATNTHTDMYSWAAVVVWAATGQPPSPDADKASSQLQRLPSVLREVVTAALSSDPATRPEVAAALARLGPTTPLPPDDGLIRGRLPVDADPPSGLQVRVARRRAELVTAALALSQWQYRAMIGIMAVAGVVLGFVAGVILREVLRALW